MNDSHENRLDDLLQAWSDSETDQLPNEDLLIEQITNRLANTRTIRSPSRPQATVGVVLACVAVCAACCVVLLPFDSDVSIDETNRLAGLQALAIPDQADVQRQTLVLDEFHRLFGSRFRWAAEEQGEVVLQVEEFENLELDKADGGPQSQAVLVRVVMQRSNGSTKSPNVIEVLTHSEQTIRLNCGPDDNSSLEIWTYVLPDGMVMVTTSLANSVTERTVDSLQPAGVATVFDSDVADPEWQIVQSVTLIGERLL